MIRELSRMYPNSCLVTIDHYYFSLLELSIHNSEELIGVHNLTHYPAECCAKWICRHPSFDDSVRITTGPSAMQALFCPFHAEINFTNVSLINRRCEFVIIDDVVINQAAERRAVLQSLHHAFVGHPLITVGLGTKNSDVCPYSVIQLS